MDNISTIILAASLFVIMLGMGLSLQISDFKRILIYPKAVLVGLANQLIILPLAGFAIASLFSLKPEIAIGIMILAACPGGATSNLISHLAKGDIALSVTLTAFSSLITIITIPFIVNFSLLYFLSEDQAIQLDVVKTIMQILIIIIVPIGIGMLIRKYKESFALRMTKPVKIASGLVLAIIIIGLLIKERDNFISYFQEAGFVALLLNISTMIIGYYSAKLFKVHHSGAISIGIESGVQNGTLAIAIAITVLDNLSFGIAPAVYSLLMFFTGGIAIFLGIRSGKK